MPQRIQLSRRKGWRLPEGAVSVARPTKWGNPFVVGGHSGLARVPAGWPLDWTNNGRHYRTAAQARAELAGKDLACWCRLDQPCHADVLLELANSAVQS